MIVLQTKNHKLYLGSFLWKFQDQDQDFIGKKDFRSIIKKNKYNAPSKRS